MRKTFKGELLAGHKDAAVEVHSILLKYGTPRPSLFGKVAVVMR
jgi:hypothetical protein